MSPSVWWHRTELVGRFREASGALPQRLWIDVGTAEGPGVVPGMVRGARALRDVARDRGLVLGRELGYLEEPGATHAMEAVAARALAALAFTLSDVDLHDDAPDSLAIHLAPSSRDLRRTTFSVSALYREGSYRLTLPPDLVTLSAPAATALEGATLRRVRGAMLRVEHRGRTAELAL
jgi:hypothetical protein